jgi:hypothetical protein
VQQLTAVAVEASTMAGALRRRRIERRLAVSARVRVFGARESAGKGISGG